MSGPFSLFNARRREINNITIRGVSIPHDVRYWLLTRFAIRDKTKSPDTHGSLTLIIEDQQRPREWTEELSIRFSLDKFANDPVELLIAGTPASDGKLYGAIDMRVDIGTMTFVRNKTERDLKGWMEVKTLRIK